MNNSGSKLFSWIDWILIVVSFFTTIITFIIPNCCVLRWIGMTLGVVGVIYIAVILYTFIANRIKFDWYLVKNDFLRKTVMVVLIVPFVLYLFMSCNISTKEMVFQDTLYECSDNNLECSYKQQQENPSLLWAIFYHYIDPGNQHMTTTKSGRNWSSTIAVFGFMLLNGMLVAVLVGWFERRRDEWIKGEVRYNCFFKRKKHYVVIGGNDMVVGIVKHLVSQEENEYSYILIQTSKEVELFRRTLYSELTDDQQKRVVIYYGNRTSKIDIEDLIINSAEEIYVLGESLADDGQNHDAYNMNCLRLITNDLQTGCEKKNVYVIFENQITFSSFQFSDISISDKEKINYIPLNYYEMWAQKIFAFSDPTDIIKTNSDATDYNHKYYPLDMIVDKEKVSYISEDDPHYVHLVVIGMTKMGVSMGLEAAHVAHYPNALTAKGPRTRITFIDENADRESGYVMNRYSDMFALCRWRYADAKEHNDRNDAGTSLYADYSVEDSTWHDPLYDETTASPYKGLKLGVDGNEIGDEFFVDIEWEFIKGGLNDFSVQQYLRECSDKEKHPNKILTVAICLEEPHQSIAGGLYLPDVVYENALQILVYQRFSDSILKYIAESVSCEEDGKNVRYKNVKSFGVLSETFSLMCVDDYIPKFINYVYCYTMYGDVNNKQIYDEKTQTYNWNVINDAGYNQINSTWNNTINKFDKGKSGCACRWSNIYNANAIRTKLRSIKWDGNNELSDNTIKIMAITEHNRWVVEQLLMHYSPVGKDDMSELERLNADGKKDEHKQKKNMLKRNMKHIDICSYNRLLEVDKGVEKYDVSLSGALPYIVSRYNREINKSVSSCQQKTNK